MPAEQRGERPWRGDIEVGLAGLVALARLEDLLDDPAASALTLSGVSVVLPAMPSGGQMSRRILAGASSSRWVLTAASRFLVACTQSTSRSSHSPPAGDGTARQPSKSPAMRPEKQDSPSRSSCRCQPVGSRNSSPSASAAERCRLPVTRRVRGALRPAEPPGCRPGPAGFPVPRPPARSWRCRGPAARPPEMEQRRMLDRHRVASLDAHPHHVVVELRAQVTDQDLAGRGPHVLAGVVTDATARARPSPPPRPRAGARPPL